MGEVVARGQITITEEKGSKTFIRYSDDGGETFTQSTPWVETNDYGNGRNLLTGGNTVKTATLLGKLNETVNNVALINKAAGGNTVRISVKVEFVGCVIKANSVFMVQTNNTNEWGWSLNTIKLKALSNGVVELYYTTDLIAVSKPSSFDLRFDYVKGTVRIYEPILTIGSDVYPYTPAPEEMQFGLTPGSWLGVATWDKPYPPTVPSAYSWSKTRGEDGTDGEDGNDGNPGADAVSVMLLPEQVVVETNSDGVVGSDTTLLANAYTVVRAYKGASQTAISSVTLSSSAGIGTAAPTKNGNDWTVKISSVGSQTVNVGGTSMTMAYPTGWVDISAVVGGVTYRKRLTVSTNIHKVAARLEQTQKGITASVSSLTSSLNNYKTTTDSKLSVMEGNISSKVEQSTYDADYKAVDKRFSQIEQTAESISLSVGGGRNLLSDTRFSHGRNPFGNLVNWNNWESIAIDGNDLVNGQFYVQMNCHGFTENKYTGLFWKVPVHEYGIYCLSVYVKCLEQGGGGWMEMHALDEGGNRISDWSHSPGNSTDWERTFFAVDVPRYVDGKTVAYVECVIIVPKDGVFRFSCPQLELGSSPTAYKPSEDDKLTSAGFVMTPDGTEWRGSLWSDGNGWRLDQDGAGHVANGAISWTADGSFSGIMKRSITEINQGNLDYYAPAEHFELLGQNYTVRTLNLMKCGRIIRFSDIPDSMINEVTLTLPTLPSAYPEEFTTDEEFEAYAMSVRQMVGVQMLLFNDTNSTFIIDCPYTGRYNVHYVNGSDIGRLTYTGDNQYVYPFSVYILECRMGIGVTRYDRWGNIININTQGAKASFVMKAAGEETTPWTPPAGTDPGDYQIVSGDGGHEKYSERIYWRVQSAARTTRNDHYVTGDIID